MAAGEGPGREGSGGARAEAEGAGGWEREQHPAPGAPPPPQQQQQPCSLDHGNGLGQQQQQPQQPARRDCQPSAPAATSGRCGKGPSACPLAPSPSQHDCPIGAAPDTAGPGCRPRHRAFAALLLLLAAAAGPSAVYGGVQTGSDFPFEGCVQDVRNSPYYATLYSYRESRGTNTSTACIQIRTLSTCTPGKYRCCNTSINKVKVFTAAEATCVGLDGHLAAIGSVEEFNFLAENILAAAPIAAGGTINSWFGLTIRTDMTGAIPGYNTDGSRISYIPTDFQYDRTRAAVRYYMMACSAASRTCGWRYSPGGASDVQPSYVCEFPAAP
ncbi:hypothetical protein TSOC_009167 [Tetrabaena socialis]|uniref:Pherophorin domain-containing protein n=1 Tax=Tetrabaena socialis TaxID=47790 RepID=A0A2J7ZWJ4_9CHLO|nr:hypothetical protein TSOC_009167 [Tetrabaena socialis]|eukprot:PNH04647.1 hypothetical protein TSOC_009167 [Tetrabaena socialis]